MCAALDSGRNELRLEPIYVSGDAIRVRTGRLAQNKDVRWRQDMATQDFGLIGLAVMGQNLSLNV